MRKIMQNALMIAVIMMFVQAWQVGFCHAEMTNYSSWSTSVTTRTFSTSTRRTTTNPNGSKKRAVTHAACPIQPSARNAVMRKVGNGANDNNCVLFLRQQRRMNLPAQNLTTYSSKLSIINSKVPRGKSVAIIKTPGRNAGIGHLAEVTGLERKDGKVIMRLAEANNPTRGYYERIITGNSLEEIQKNANIVGYYVEPNELIRSESTSMRQYN